MQANGFNVQERSPTGVPYHRSKSYFGVLRGGCFYNEAVESHSAAPADHRQLNWHTSSDIGTQICIAHFMFVMLAVSPLCRAQTQQASLDASIEVVRAGTADRVTIITAAMNSAKRMLRHSGRFIGNMSTNGLRSTTAASPLSRSTQRSTRPWAMAMPNQSHKKCSTATPAWRH